MSLTLNRREALALGAASLASLTLKNTASAQTPALSTSFTDAHDETLGNRLRNQVKAPESRWCGAIPDGTGLHTPHSAADLLYLGAAAYFHHASSWHKSQELLDGMKRAAEFLERAQSPEGNIDLMSTNFNSPPDTAFIIHKIATAARIARMNKDKTVEGLLRTFLRRAGNGMAQGGIHTPNHRWVVCAALAQLHELYPQKAYLNRINAWLAEGIDLDEEGQYIERSTAIYNGVVNHAFTVMALKLGRPELLEPVRANLNAMAYLVRANGDVVTEISERQDAGQRGTMRQHWFALRYLAIRDCNGQYASMLAPLEPAHIELAALMEYPEMQQALPEPEPLPDNFRRVYPLSGVTLIRNGRTSATLFHGRRTRKIQVHHGAAVINGFRFASAFFGKGEFVPDTVDLRDDGIYYRQELSAGYYQPLDGKPVPEVTRENWTRLRAMRRTSENCAMVYEAHIRQISGGFEIRVSASGTGNVPLAVEISLQSGAEIEGVVPAPNAAGAFLLREGYATCRAGEDVIRIGPGKAEHGYTQVRGAAGKLPGDSIYFTGLTPFEHTFTIALG